jgi:high-affinity iron transporter
MLGSALIVFREMFEASLIISIVLAATRGLLNRGFWVSTGAVAGTIGAGIVAYFADVIFAAAQGMGQELLNAIVLFVAVAMLVWHQIWMSQHGREMAQKMKTLGAQIKDKGRPMWVVAIVVGLAILREGSEAVLFMYGVVAGSADTFMQLLAGGLLGLLGGAAIGTALYFGLVKIPAKLLFSVTGWMIILLAAGMASQGASFLVQAGMLPALSEQVWNTSAILESSSIVGRALHTLVGYDDRPAGIQLVFYAATILGMVFFTKLLAARQRGSK